MCISSLPELPPTLLLLDYFPLHVRLARLFGVQKALCSALFDTP
jgi:hypothetical protein